MYWNNKYEDLTAEHSGRFVEEEMPEVISVMSNTRCAKVPIEDIEAIEQVSRQLHIITGNDDYVCYERIDKIAPLLIGRNFYRPMKSLIVNFDRIREVSGLEITFVSGQSMTLGRNNFTKLRMAYKRFLQNYPPFTNWGALDMVAESEELLLNRMNKGSDKKKSTKKESTKKESSKSEQKKVCETKSSNEQK